MYGIIIFKLCLIFSLNLVLISGSELCPVVVLSLQCSSCLVSVIVDVNALHQNITIIILILLRIDQNLCILGIVKQMKCDRQNQNITLLMNGHLMLWVVMWWAHTHILFVDNLIIDDGWMFILFILHPLDNVYCTYNTKAPAPCNVHSPLDIKYTIYYLSTLHHTNCIADEWSRYFQFVYCYTASLYSDIWPDDTSRIEGSALLQFNIET